MDKRESKDSEVTKRLTYVSTESLQSRLPEMLVCLMEGDTVVIRHRGKTIGYMMPRHEDVEQGLRELDKAAAERLRVGRKDVPKVEITRTDIIDLVRHARE